MSVRQHVQARKTVEGTEGAVGWGAIAPRFLANSIFWKYKQILKSRQIVKNCKLQEYCQNFITMGNIANITSACNA